MGGGKVGSAEMAVGILTPGRPLGADRGEVAPPTKTLPAARGVVDTVSPNVLQVLSGDLRHISLLMLQYSKSDMHQLAHSRHNDGHSRFPFCLQPPSQRLDI